ncbi:uroporphyrinogen-III synthase [Pseudooceanicola sp. LIPI14-2-Ac024]|uniref:uroporphyrinogen-III synthase n=1 Tax=Pseudooceanicola sp. LIPI14-2-Ac024 TaxID=3344875 RepID=UPI0035CF82EB
MTPVILLTRPAPDAEAFAAMLRDRLDGVAVLISPLLRIEPVGDLPGMAGIDGLIFTSRNGVRAYAAQGGPARPCYCVGEGTAEVARAAGMDVLDQAEDAATLLPRIVAARPAGRWLHLHGRHLRMDFGAELRAAGIAAGGRAIYDQRAEPLTDAARDALSGNAPVIAPVFSPRTGKLLVQGENPRAPVYIVAMSPAVAEAVAPWSGAKCTIAGQPDLRSMVDTVVVCHDRVSRVEGTGAAK